MWPSSSSTLGTQQTDTQSITNTFGLSLGQSDARGRLLSHGETHGMIMGVSITRGATESVSYQLQQIMKYREERQLTGKPRRSIPDQVAAVGHVLSILPMTYLLMRLNDTPTFLLRIAELVDPDVLARRSSNDSAWISSSNVSSISPDRFVLTCVPAIVLWYTEAVGKGSFPAFVRGRS